MRPITQKGRGREVEVPDISAKCKRFNHVAQAHDKVIGAAASVEQTRRLLPWARRMALGVKS